MSLITKLPIILEESKEASQSILEGRFAVSEKIGHGDNILAHADNIYPL